MNRIEMIGRLTNDIELRFTPGGLAIGKATLAVDRGYSREKRDQLKKENKATADFPRIIMSGKLAENASKYLKKGSLVGVEGAVRTGSYDNAEGHKIYTTEIYCDKVHFLEGVKKDTEPQSESYQAEEFEIEEIPF